MIVFDIQLLKPDFRDINAMNHMHMRGFLNIGRIKTKLVPGYNDGRHDDPNFTPKVNLLVIVHTWG